MKAVLEIEMPENCGECRCGYPEYTKIEKRRRCCLLGYLVSSNPADVRHPDCPLKILPDCTEAEKTADGKSKVDDKPGGSEMKKDYRCPRCINDNCIIKILDKLGNKIATAYNRSLDVPEWQDITEYLPKVISCRDFFPQIPAESNQDFDRLFENKKEA